MSEPSEPRRLGRGLSALLAAVEAPAQEAVLHNSLAERTLPIERIVANPNQPRKTFDSEALLKGRREILIRHGDRIYRLRHTSNDKLILTK